MTDHTHPEFEEVLTHLKGEQTVVHPDGIESQLQAFSFSLLRNGYFPVIVTDYPVDIIDKKTLLEALYYQAKLVTMHDLNWDALDEGLHDMLESLIHFEGVILLFRNGRDLELKLKDEWGVFIKIVEELDLENKTRCLKVVYDR